MSTKETNTSIDKAKIVELLERFDIEHWLYGKNVTIDNVNVQCPYCNDHSNHMGISPEGAFHCWKCSATGFFPLLLSKLTGHPYRYCIGLVESQTNFKKPTSQVIKELLNKKKDIVEESEKDIVIEVPKFSKRITTQTKSELLERFLLRRNIKLSTVLTYGAYICEHGVYANRMIIPIMYQDQMVSWQAADLTGRAEIKYMTAPEVKVNQYLYDYDWIKDRMIVVEGILDVWRLKHDVVCTFGTSLTNKQRYLIRTAELKELIFCWDSDAFWKARTEAEQFKLSVPTVRVVKMPSGHDPDSYGRTRTMELIERSLQE